MIELLLIDKFFLQLFELFKSKILVLIQVICAFLLPIKPLIILVGFLIILDTISGIWKAKKIKEEITSRKLSRIISKMLLYQCGLITFFILEKYLFGEFIIAFSSIEFLFTKIVAVFFCCIELTSLNENIKVVYGQNFFQLFKSMLTRVMETKKQFSDISKKN